MNLLLLVTSEDLSTSGMAALKTVGAIALACVLLFVVLLFTKKFGIYWEHKKYLQYTAFYREQHGSDEGMLTEEEFIKERAEGRTVVWKRTTGAASSQPQSEEAPTTQECPTPEQTNLEAMATEEEEARRVQENSLISSTEDNATVQVTAQEEVRHDSTAQEQPAENESA